MRISLIQLLVAGLLLASACQTTPKVGLTAQQFQQPDTKTLTDYWLYLPEGYSKNRKKQWPLMLFLHGAGERGTNLTALLKHGPPKLVNNGKQFPFIIVSPQCPAHDWWSVDQLDSLLDSVITKYRVDTNRVYLTGLSMGGFATWALAAKHPERFAAIAPICGGGQTNQAQRLKDLPIWVFHGAKDKVVPVLRSQQMVDALKAFGSDVKLTVYPDADHDSWTRTYDNPKFYEWLLEQKRGPWMSLFNGKDLTGWTVKCLPKDKGKEFWKVVDGAILCDSIGQKNHKYVWLVTDQEFGNFELKLKFQSYTNSNGNSGIQIRSRYDESAQWLDGPQVDIHPPTPWRTGLIYDETRGEQRWINPSLKGSSIDASHAPENWNFKYANEWNDLVIICRGQNIKTILNGVVMSDYDGTGVLDNAAHKAHNVGQQGHIALQLHSGDELRIRFKDIKVRNLIPSSQ